MACTWSRLVTFEAVREPVDSHGGYAALNVGGPPPFRYESVSMTRGYMYLSQCPIGSTVGMFPRSSKKSTRQSIPKSPLAADCAGPSSVGPDAFLDRSSSYDDPAPGA